MDVPADQVQAPFVSQSRYRALVLDPGMQPIDVVNWQRALVLDMLAKVEVLEYYQGVTVNSVSAEFFLPAVLMAKKVGRNASKFSRVPLNRRNIMIRDNLTCQYCGKKPSRGKVMSGLTLDHIVPQCRNGGVRALGVVALPVVSVLRPPGSPRPPVRHSDLLVVSPLLALQNTWTNLVTACSACNTRKADRLLSELNSMKLLSTPKEPSPFDLTMQLAMLGLGHGHLSDIPEEWSNYLFLSGEDSD